jgi:hypothetical protein
VAAITDLICDQFVVRRQPINQLFFTLRRALRAFFIVIVNWSQ